MITDLLPSGASPRPSIVDPAVAEDPASFYAELRANAPVVRDSALDAVLISRYDDVAAIYRDRRFSTRSYAGTIEAAHGRTVLSMDGQEHAKNRALLTPHFRGRGLERLHSVIAGSALRILTEIVPARAGTLLDDLAPPAGADVPIDLVARFAHRFPVAVIADMLGLPEQDHDLFAGWYGHIMDFVGNLGGDAEIHARGLAAKASLRAYMAPLIAERRQHPGPDLISTIVQSEVDGFRMGDEDVQSYVSLLLTAGGETTDKAFSSMCMNLLRTGGMTTVRDDRTLLPAAIAETLRFSPPSQITTRMAEEDLEVGGRPIGAGTTVFLLVGAANRDESRFVRADEFVLGRPDLDPTRAFSGAAGHLAFGMGRHFCLGALLAKTEMEVGLTMLLDAYPDLRLADGPPPVEVGLKTRGPRELMVHLT